MGNYLLKLNKSSLSLITKIGSIADRHKLPAYLVGGVVRDIILKKRIVDIDIVVEGDLKNFVIDVSKELAVPFVYHEKFHTASIIFSEGARMDFASARVESYVASGALPKVKEATINEDLFRRDFTMNALAISINNRNQGCLLDPFLGVQDLNDGIVRVFHDKSFVDDPTRILRAVRFQQRFGFAVEKKTKKLMKEALDSGIVANVKSPRYFAEFKKILFEENPVLCLRAIHHWGGLSFIGTKFDFTLLARVQRNIVAIKKDFFYCSFKRWWLVYFMALVKDIEDIHFSKILSQFNLKGREKKSLLQSRTIFGVISKLKETKLNPSFVYEILEKFNKDVIIYLRLQGSNKTVCRYIDTYLKHSSFIHLSINGKTLQKLGLPIGDAMGKILREIFYLKLDHGFDDKESEIFAAKKLIEKEKNESFR